ncbi:MAG: hypothetical protein OXH96_10730 [Spirochaetaceae bacterium]|nr:hypothetical protein [Spirochaetaceae bacterium]
MVIALLVLQAAGLVVLYLLLRRAVARRMNDPDVVSELRAEVAALVTEMNAATERNVALLEDGVGRLQDLLGRVDDVSAASAARARSPADRPARESADRRAEVLRLRRMGMSNAAIVDHLATSPAEVELIVNLADGADGRGARRR